MTEVWIVYRNHGPEGCSEPLAAFSSERLANIFVSGASYNYTRMEVTKLSVASEIGGAGLDLHSRSPE